MRSRIGAASFGGALSARFAFASARASIQPLDVRATSFVEAVEMGIAFIGSADRHVGADVGRVLRRERHDLADHSLCGELVTHRGLRSLRESLG